MTTLKPKWVPHGGTPTALGATVTPDGVNFAVYSETASAVFVCLFDGKDREIARFALDGHQDNVHFGLVANIAPGQRYGLRADGPYDPAQAYLFDPQKLLIDPYAKRLDRPFERRPELALPRSADFDTAPIMPKALVCDDQFEPAQARRKSPGLIYELNVRGFTRLHPAVPGLLRGTVAGLTNRKVIDHLKSIGVDTVELMPVTAWIDDAHLPGLGLRNAWGYNPVGYFAPDPRLMPGGIADLRAMTDVYRKNGISVILDVVYNHTGESDANGPILSLKGLDARTYYRHVGEHGALRLVNDAGTGNTLACDHPAVQRLVIDSLRYWMEVGGVSGFRFDLATILGRQPGFDPQAPMLEMIKADPLIGKGILIAEPWDTGPGGYQLGRFGKPFREWNDTYRDDVRLFWRGDQGKIGALASKLSGSSEIFNFAGRTPSASVNFVAAHDGFTLADLVSHAHKHNQANGEDNRDGHDHNASWNGGAEGQTDDPAVLARRQRDSRALLATLFLSRGTPMLGQGDEMGRTQRGNNNAYAQDNELTWVDWGAADAGLIDFVASLNAFRKAHPALTHDHFLTGQVRHGLRDVTWLHPEGWVMGEADWHHGEAGVLGMHLVIPGDEVLVWFNRTHHDVYASLPKTVGEWRPDLVSAPGVAVAVGGGKVLLPARSVVALVASESGL